MKRKIERNKKIYEEYKKGGVSMYDLAIKYGVRQTAIFQIITRERKDDNL